MSNNKKYLVEQQEISCQRLDLGNLIEDVPDHVDESYVLVIREGVKYCGVDLNRLKEELTLFEWDRQFWDYRRKRVLNKHARSNVCFGTNSSEPDYENKKGRIVGFSDVPQVSLIKEGLSILLG